MFYCGLSFVTDPPTISVYWKMWMLPADGRASVRVMHEYHSHGTSFGDLREWVSDYEGRYEIWWSLSPGPEFMALHSGGLYSETAYEDARLEESAFNEFRAWRAWSRELETEETDVEDTDAEDTDCGDADSEDSGPEEPLGNFDERQGSQRHIQPFFRRLVLGEHPSRRRLRDHRLSPLREVMNAGGSEPAYELLNGRNGHNIELCMMADLQLIQPILEFTAVPAVELRWKYAIATLTERFSRESDLAHQRKD